MPEKESFKVMIARLRRERAELEARIRAALEESPALIVETSGGRPELIIISPETYKGELGKIRASYFDVHGPWSHTTQDDLDGVVKELASRDLKQVRPASEDEVLAWTDTPEFIEGCKQVAFTQADNELRFLAGKIDKETYERAWVISRKAYDLARVKGVEAGTKLLLEALDELRAR